MSKALEILNAGIGAESLSVSEFRDNRRVVVPAEKVFESLKLLKAGGFDFLCDIAGIDYLGYPDAADRYGVVYSLTCTTNGERIFLKTFVNDPDPSLPSVCSLWQGANWMEREIYDMYGITFANHPDHRRILLPDEFTSYPLRKDYPLRGYGERHNFPTVTRADS